MRLLGSTQLFFRVPVFEFSTVSSTLFKSYLNNETLDASPPRLLLHCWKLSSVSGANRDSDINNRNNSGAAEARWLKMAHLKMAQDGSPQLAITPPAAHHKMCPLTRMCHLARPPRPNACQTGALLLLPTTGPISARTGQEKSPCVLRGLSTLTINTINTV